MTELNLRRLDILEGLTLAVGAHDSYDDGMCAMEAAAWLAEEDHSDHPACVSPVLGSFLRSLNDSLDDDARQALKPYLPRVIGTAGDGHDEERAWMATDWLIRECAPTWLDLAGMGDHASALRDRPPIDGKSRAEEAMSALRAARAAAWDAAWAAAWAAARAAAQDAAWAAAGGALTPTVAALQQSAHDLLDRMIDGPDGVWLAEREER